jgi:hypothetical protein
MVAQQIELLKLFFNVLMILLGYSVLYERTRLDCFREDLFTIRDELFDYMWKNQLPYDMPAYGYLRDTLNGMIRSIDGMHFMALLSVSVRYQNALQKDLVAEAIGTIENVAVRKHFLAVYNRVRTRTIHHFYLEGLQSLVFKPVQMLSRYAHRRQIRAGTIVDRCYRWMYTQMDQWTNECLFLGRKGSPEAKILRESSPFAVSL